MFLYKDLYIWVFVLSKIDLDLDFLAQLLIFCIDDLIWTVLCKTVPKWKSPDLITSTQKIKGSSGHQTLKITSPLLLIDESRDSWRRKQKASVKESESDKGSERLHLSYCIIRTFHIIRISFQCSPAQGIQHSVSTSLVASNNTRINLLHHQPVLAGRTQLITLMGACCLLTLCMCPCFHAVGLPLTQWPLGELT